MSFRTRLLRQQVLILALAIVASTTLYSIFHRALLTRSLEMHGAALTRGVAADLQPERASATLTAISEEEDVEYAIIYGPNGRLTARWPDDAPEGDLLGSTVERIARAGLYQVAPDNRPRVREFYRASTSDGRVTGVVRIGLSTQRAMAARRDFVLLSILASLSVLVGAVVATLLVVRRMADPLARLTQGARAFGAGQLDVRIDEGDRDDEIGELAEAFNRMAEDLNELLSGLEDTLGERTAELARQKPRLESLLDSVDEGVMMLDTEGRFVLANQRFHELFGLDDTVIVGTHYSELYDRVKNALPEMPRLLERARHFHKHPEEKAVDVFELTLPTHRVIQRFSAPVHQLGQDGGPIVGRIEVLRDITREVEVDRMKNEFVSTVSHELRTPLTSIKGSLGLILGGAAGHLSDEATDLIEIAHANTERLIRLINDILDISKIESGRMRFELTEIDLGNCLRQTVRGLEAFADNSGVTVSMEIPDQGLPVIADGDRIAQVVTNLLSNAIKFSSRDDTVTVRLRVKDHFYRIQVTDQGPGISAEDIPKLFRKFSQLQHTLDEARGGTGLGLAICRALVQEHGGDIWVRSAPGEGSTFAFTLPRPREAMSAVARAGEAGSSLERPHVVALTGDPEPTLDAHLEAAGYDVTRVGEPDDVQEHVRRRRTDAILLDPAHPDALPVLRALKDDPETRRIPAFLAAQNGDSFTLSLRVADWLVRPVAQDRLVRSSRDATTERSGPRPVALLLEDDPDQADVLTTGLKRAGFDVVAVTDGHQALGEIKQRAPDLVLVDLAMPGRDAFATMANLRASRGGRRAPVLFVTDAQIDDDTHALIVEGLQSGLARSADSEQEAGARIVEALDTALESRERMTGDSSAPVI